jgi:hypothetical protein
LDSIRLQQRISNTGEITVLTMRNSIVDNGSGFDRLVPLPECKRILGIGFPRLTDMIREGVLPAHNIGGRPVRRADVTEETRGLRIPESALREYIEQSKI